MSASGDEIQPECDPSVTEAFRQIADIYVEASRDATESDPDLCLGIPEPSRTTADYSSDRS